MAGKLQKEIGKSGPFASLEEEAMLNLLRTADRMSGPIEPAMKGKKLTLTQYNVLRILRGVSPQGISCQEIARRMITRDADLTRLVDRLERRGLAARERGAKDRRVVRVAITAAGLELLADLDAPVSQANHKALGHMGSDKLRELIDLLEVARDGLSQSAAQTEAS